MARRNIKPIEGTSFGVRYATVAREKKNGKFQPDARIGYSGNDIKSYKGDSKKAGARQKADAYVAQNTRSHAKQRYDIARAFGASVG